MAAIASQTAHSLPYGVVRTTIAKCCKFYRLKLKWIFWRKIIVNKTGSLKKCTIHLEVCKLFVQCNKFLGFISALKDTWDRKLSVLSLYVNKTAGVHIYQAHIFCTPSPGCSCLQSANYDKLCRKWNCSKQFLYYLTF